VVERPEEKNDCLSLQTNGPLEIVQPGIHGPGVALASGSDKGGG
jgi:hypothetical protein